MASVPVDRQIESTYVSLAARVRRIVARNISAPPPLIEEACQIAWSRWLPRRESIPSACTLGWLATTATREAIRLVRLGEREVPLDSAELRAGIVIELPAREPGPDQLAELHDRLAEVHRLPVRQQRMVWLHGFGFDYNEIGSRTGDTRRTVERQLLRAKRKLRTDGRPA